MEFTNPSDILEAILNFYPEDTFKNQREKIHQAFFQIRQNHFDLLRDFVFKRNILFPRSKILDEALSVLQPDTVGKINPTYDTYQIKKGNLKKRWEQKLKKMFTPEIISELEQVAGELHELLN